MEQMLPLLFSVFQDDILELAVGSTVCTLALKIEDNAICGTLGVGLSSKPEANRPFSTRFECIGAYFITEDPTYITRRLALHVLEAVERDLVWLEANRCRLVDELMVQRVVGRLTFCARFLDHGRARLNSAYAALAGERHIQCRGQKAMISREMARKVEAIAGEIRSAR